MKTIATRYLGSTNCRGARIKASDEDGNSITLPYDSALDNNNIHMKAAVALCKKMDWLGVLHGGHTKSGMAWVFHDKDLMYAVTRPTIKTDAVCECDIPEPNENDFCGRCNLQVIE